jgi:hypothetical protein
MEIITRKQAREQGLKTYFTGKPCKHGNIAERGVVSPYCLCRDCRDERNGRGQAWRAEHPDRQAASTRNWQLNNWEAQQEVWRRAEKNKQQRDAADPDYREHRRAQSRKHALDSNRRRYGVDQEYTERVKAKSAHHKVKRRRLMALVELTSQEELQVKAIYRLRYTLSRETGTEYHVDHRIPLKHGGKHHPSNLWVITATENLRKGAKLPEELVA